MILTIGILLCLKHFIADGLLQTAYMYKNKGNLFHLGGWAHAAIHACLTSLIFTFTELNTCLLLTTIDFLSHYFIDYAKVNITKRYNCCTAKENYLIVYDNKFFIAIVADQCLHFAVYFMMLSLI